MSRPRAFAVGVLVLLLAGVGTAAALGFRHDAREREEARADAVRVAAQVVRGQVASTIERTEDVAGLFSASNDVTRAEFSRFAGPMVSSTGASAFGFARPVAARERAATERAMGGPILDLAPDRALVPAARRDAYLVVTQVRTARRARSVRGLDLSADAERGPTVADALRSNQVRATLPLRFASTGQVGVVFYAPALDARGHVIGAAFGSFPVGRLVDRVRAQLPEDATFSVEEDGRALARAGRGRDTASTTVEVAGRSWRISAALPSGPRLGWGPLALVVGGLLLALIGLAMASLLAQARRVTRIAELRSEERDRAERLQQASEDSFATAFAHAPVGMAIHDAAGCVVIANDAYAAIVGMPTGDLPGVHPARFVHADDLRDSAAAVAALRRDELTTAHLEQRMVRPDGTSCWVAVHLTRFGEEGEATLAHVVDVTARKATESERERLLEDERRQAERLREIDVLRDEFVGLATHELRSPLTTITGYVDLILEDRDRMPAEHAAFLDTIARTSGQLLDLADNLLDLTRLQDARTQLELGPVSLAAVARDVLLALAPQATAKGLSLESDLPTGVAVVGDAITLRQAATNLICNAIKYTPRGGAVRVSVSAEGELARLCVRDDGIGIPEAERHRLFERFFRATSATDRQILGTGLGLAITKGIAEAHHGSLEVAHHDPGTSFALLVPALPSPVGPVVLDGWLDGEDLA